VTGAHVGDPFQSIAKWRDKVWVGDCYLGLSVLEGSELSVVKPRIGISKALFPDTTMVTDLQGASKTQAQVSGKAQDRTGFDRYPLVTLELLRSYKNCIEKQVRITYSTFFKIYKQNRHPRVMLAGIQQVAHYGFPPTNAGTTYE